MELVSIIVPVYNVEKYVKKCIDSILNQTYQNIEILVIDDGSTDNSKIICDELANRDKRIRVFRKENGGLSSARNYGIKRAHGKYLMFIDSDDYISQNTITNMVENSQNADLVICNFLKVDTDGNKLQQEPDLNEKQIWNYGEFWNHYFGQYWGYCVVAWNKLYKRELFKELKYPLGKIHEDEFIIEPLIEKCNKIVALEDRLYFYVQRNGSITHNGLKNKGNLNVAEAFLERYKLFVEFNNLPQRLLNKQLQMIPYSIIAGLFEDKELYKVKREKFKLYRSQYNYYVSKLIAYNFDKKLFMKRLLLNFPFVYYLIIKIAILRGN